MNKWFKATFIITGLATITSAVVLPIGFTNISRIQNEYTVAVKNQKNNNETTRGVVEFEPGTINPNELDPNFCDGWIPTVTVLITFNVCAIIATIVIILYLVFRRKLNLKPNLADY